MKAIEVLNYIKEKMIKYHTYCVTARIYNEFLEYEDTYIFTSDILRKELNAYSTTTGIIKAELCSNCAEHIGTDFRVIRVHDIVDNSIY